MTGIFLRKIERIARSWISPRVVFGYNVGRVRPAHPRANSAVAPKDLRRMQTLGRVLQVVALAGLPLAIPLQLFHVIDLRAMLALMVGSVCLFYIGRIVEGYARR